MTENNTIAYIATYSNDSESKGWGTPIEQTIRRNVSDLKESLADEARKITEMLTAISESENGFTLDEAELTLELTSEGGFRMVGSVSATAGATMMLRFRRVKTNSETHNREVSA